VSRLRALRLLPLLLAAVVAGGAAGAVEARPAATAPNDAAVEKLERIVRARVDSRRTTGIVAVQYWTRTPPPPPRGTDDPREVYRAGPVFGNVP
jgi:hypothetical protein